MLPGVPGRFVLFRLGIVTAKTGQQSVTCGVLFLFSREASFAPSKEGGG